MPRDHQLSRGQLLKRERPQELQDGIHEISLSQHHSEGKQFKVPTADVVIKALRKLTADESDTPRGPRLVEACILVCTTEADYFESDPEAAALLKLDLGVADFSIAAPTEGSIDRCLYLSGTIECVLRASVYIAFVLAARTSRAAYLQHFTLKSPNYVLALMTKNDPKTSPPQFDTLKHYEALTYPLNPEVIVHYLLGDLSSIFAVMVLLLTLSPRPPTKLSPPDIYASANRAGLYQRSSDNEALLSASSKADIFRHV